MTQHQQWGHVRQVWRNSRLDVRLGATDDEIVAFEHKYNVRLPFDVRSYFQAENGTGWEMDKDYYRFWSLDQVEPVSDILSDVNPDRYAYPDCYVFADYCIDCWDYAIFLCDDAEQPAPVFRVTGSDKVGEQMTSTFAEFMQQYSENPDNII